MADAQIEARDLLHGIVEFSKALSQVTPYAWEAQRCLYSTIFVRAAEDRNVLEVIDEIQLELEQTPLTLFHLIPGLVDKFGDLRHPEWHYVRNYICRFYETYKKTGRSIYDPTKKIPQQFRPLPSLYYSIRKEVEIMKASKTERTKVVNGLLQEVLTFEKENPLLPRPVRKKYVTLPKLADPEQVWKVKEETFKLIFQRTRELFHFQNEEAHFHHAAAIVDFVHGILKKRFKPDNRNDKVAFEKIAQGLKCFQTLFVETLEKTQKNLDIATLVTYVTEKLSLSRKFKKVRSVVHKDFEKGKRLLALGDYELPGLIDSKASLALTLYRLMHERQLAFDDLAYVTDRIKKMIHQLEGWERVTGIRTNVSLLVDTRQARPVAQYDLVQMVPTPAVQHDNMQVEPALAPAGQQAQAVTAPATANTVQQNLAFNFEDIFAGGQVEADMSSLDRAIEAMDRMEDGI